MKLYRGFSSQEEIDTEYNVERMVPSLAPHIEVFVGESARARGTLKCALDVRFGPTVDETMDIFPATNPGAPVIVFIHGGYWRRLSSKEFDLVALGLAAHGFTVVVTNYSLCPKVSISEITRQSRAVVAWLWQHAGDYNGDRNQLFVCGHSAGGQQVGMLAATDWPREYGLPANLIRAGIPISGVFDLRPLHYSWLQPKILLTHEVIERESPCLHVPTNGWPMLVAVGGAESKEFQRQSSEYHEALVAGGTKSRLYIAPDHNHFTIIEALADPDSVMCREIVQFVRAHVTR